MKVYELTILFLSLHQHIEELALAATLHKTAEEDVRNGYTQGDAEDGERCLDGIVHTHSYLAYHAMHINEGEEGTIHQYSRYHRYHTRDGDALMRGMEPVASLDHNDADEGRTSQRTDAQTPPTAPTGNNLLGMLKMVEKPIADTAAAMANSQYSW